MSRQTVRRALEELMELGVIERVGQLDRWMDTTPGGERVRKLGAYVYSLNVRCRKLGDRALSTLRRGASGLAGASSPSKCHVRTTGHGKRVDGALRWALGWAQPGNRNETGRWLSWRCTDAGLSEGQAMKVMELYRDNVPDKRTFPLREVERTVRSRYRKVK